MMSADDLLEYLYMLIYFQILISFLNMYLYYAELNAIRYDIQLL
jgi:hypothetical protein